MAQRIISTDPAVDRWQMCKRPPVCSASRTSLAIIVSSAIAGQPLSPSTALSSPSFIWEFSVRAGSWACCAITPPKDFVYSRARLISKASLTHLPSSLKTFTLAVDWFIRLKSARALPSRPLVTAPIGNTSTYPARSPRFLIISTTAALSATGLVLAMA